MKTTKTFKAVICAAVIMAVGCTGLIAQPKAEDDNGNMIELVPNYRPPFENEELRTISGKIGTFTKYGIKYITITSASKKTYIIDVDAFARENYSRMPGNENNFTDEDEVTVEYLKNNVGKKVTLTGILNKECGVFSVIKSGTIPRPQSPQPVNELKTVDAK